MRGAQRSHRCKAGFRPNGSIHQLIYRFTSTRTSISLLSPRPRSAATRQPWVKTGPARDQSPSSRAALMNQRSSKPLPGDEESKMFGLAAPSSARAELCNVLSIPRSRALPRDDTGTAVSPHRQNRPVGVVEGAVRVLRGNPEEVERAPDLRSFEDCACRSAFRKRHRGPPLLRPGPESMCVYRYSRVSRSSTLG